MTSQRKAAWGGVLLLAIVCGAAGWHVSQSPWCIGRCRGPILSCEEADSYLARIPVEQEEVRVRVVPDSTFTAPQSGCPHAHFYVERSLEFPDPFDVWARVCRDSTPVVLSLGPVGPDPDSPMVSADLVGIELRALDAWRAWFRSPLAGLECS